MKFIDFCDRHFMKLCAISWIIGISQTLFVAIRDRSLDNFLGWKMTQYYVSYFEVGFVKRGLVGTLLYPFFEMARDDRSIAVLIVVLFDLLVILCVLIAVRGVIDIGSHDGDKIIKILKVALIFSPVGMMQFSLDTGRFDHLNILIAATSLVLILKGMSFYAGALLGVGVLVHEAIIIFAFPALLSIVIEQHGARLSSKSFYAALKFAIIPLFFAIAVYLFGNAHGDLTAGMPAWARQGAGVWSRNLLEPNTGLSGVSFSLLVFYAICPYLFLLSFYRANALSLDILFFSPWFSVFLFAVGIDYARWCQLIFVSCLLVVAYHMANGRRLLQTKSFTGTLLFIAYAFPLGPIGVIEPLPYIETIIRRLL